MREFKRNSSDRSGGNRFGSRNDSRGSDRPEMTEAICDDCGKKCRVPFRPTGDKPIYCSDCYEKRGNGMDRDRGNDRGNDRRSNYRDDRNSRDREMFDAVCDECGKDCKCGCCK